MWKYAAILAVVHHVRSMDARARHNTTLSYICILSIVDFVSMLPLPMTIIDFRCLDFGCLVHSHVNFFDYSSILAKFSAHLFLFASVLIAIALYVISIEESFAKSHNRICDVMCDIRLNLYSLMSDPNFCSVKGDCCTREI
uniref:G-protein coupled receptor n=1 Tax=Ascaris suum TaxID=6253 RepID=F1LG23_ASCSU